MATWQDSNHTGCFIIGTIFTVSEKGKLIFKAIFCNLFLGIPVENYHCIKTTCIK